MEEPEYTVSDDVIAALDSGRPIEAVKLLRQETGLGLKEAKDVIDALAQERRGKSQLTTSMPEEGGASGLIKLLLVIAVLLAGYSYFFAD